MSGEPIYLDQAWYGSESGVSNYQVLGRSEGLSNEQVALIEDYSNLGGSLLNEPSPVPSLAYYRVDEEHWALAKTYFPSEEMGPRGNDYRVRVLVLDNRAVDALRGNVLLLEPALSKLCVAGETEPGETLAPILLRETFLSKARSPLSSPGQWEMVFAKLLANLVEHKRVAVCIKKSDNIIAFCKALFKLLPPDDRGEFSFCTYFSYGRDLDFDLAFFVQNDESLVKNYISDRISTVGSLRDLNPTEREINESVKTWLDFLAKPAASLFGVSALEDPARFTQLISGVEQIKRWREIGTATIKQVDMREGLLAIGRHPQNRKLPGFDQLFELSFCETLHDHLMACLGKETSVKEIIELSEVAKHALKGADIGRLEAVIGHFGQDLDGASLVVFLMLTIEICRPPRIDLLWEGLSRDPSGLKKLYGFDQIAFKHLVKKWVETWRDCYFLKKEKAKFTYWKKILSGLMNLKPSGAPVAEFLCREFCNAAPTRAAPEKRKKWFLEMFAELHLRSPRFFPNHLATQVALDEDLLHRLSEWSRREVTSFILDNLTEDTKNILFQMKFDNFNWMVLDEFLSVMRSRMAQRAWKSPNRGALGKNFVTLCDHFLKIASELIIRAEPSRGKRLLETVMDTICFLLISLRLDFMANKGGVIGGLERGEMDRIIKGVGRLLRVFSKTFDGFGAVYRKTSQEIACLSLPKAAVNEIRCALENYNQLPKKKVLNEKSRHPSNTFRDWIDYYRSLAVPAELIWKLKKAVDDG